jgi:hypothetical protein
MQNNSAYLGIRQILVETNSSQGWTIPNYVLDWEARVLADRIDRSTWQPEPSYAECYMTIRTPGAAIELGNTCWFTRAVFPELGTRRGIDSSYYVQLGQGCFELALKHCDNPTLRTLCKNFEFLAETVYTAIRCNGDFRSMWD